MNIVEWFKNLFGGSGKPGSSPEDVFNLIIIKSKTAPDIAGKVIYIAAPGKQKIQVSDGSMAEGYQSLPKSIKNVTGVTGSGKYWCIQTSYETEKFKLGTGYFSVKDSKKGKNNELIIALEGEFMDHEFMNEVRSALKRKKEEDTKNDQTGKEADASTATTNRVVSSTEDSREILNLSEKSEGYENTSRTKIEDTYSATDNSTQIEVNSDKVNKYPISDSGERNEEDSLADNEEDDDIALKSSTVVNFGGSVEQPDASKSISPMHDFNEDKVSDSGNVSSIAQMSKDIAKLKQENESFRNWVIKELKKMNSEMEYSKDLPLDTLLNRLREEIYTLSSKYSDAKSSMNAIPDLKNKAEDLKKVRSEKERLQKDFDDLNKRLGTSSRKIKELELVLDQTNETLNNAKDSIREKENVILTLNSQITNQQIDLNAKDEELSVLRSSDAGQLKAQLEQKETDIVNLNEVLTETQNELDAANADIDYKAGQIDQKNDQIQKLKEEKNSLNAQLNNKNKEVTKLVSDLKKANETISEKAKKISVLETEKSTLEETIIERETTIETKDGQLNQLSKEKHTLEAEVIQCNQTIEKLNIDKDLLSSQKSELQDVIHKDVDAQFDVYSTAVDALNKALEPEFLKECDLDSETDTVESMCAKIRKGVTSFSKAVLSLKDEYFESTIALKKAYEKIVADNIESHAFTEIARWWAYSRLPFVLDKSREEGRSVEMSSIDTAYAALSRILMLAGYRYQMPVLFVQNLSDGNYKNVTGSEQMNLDYQIPNVRAHVENIDRDDRENVILDIVQLGYYKGNELVKKTSVIV